MTLLKNRKKKLRYLGLKSANAKRKEFQQTIQEIRFPAMKYPVKSF